MGNYSKEGDCYNREHSFPQSWFNSQSPMQSDLFHVYPTDGYVNGRRASFPYGDVAVATWTSSNGSKLGTSAVNGYTGTVFEPIDEYKGDFARTYFYMVTRYKDIASGFNSDMLTGDNLSTWAIDMLLTWSNDDPVSTKEIDRNNAIYDIQNNRNPYIDDPQYIDLVWGDGVLAINEKSNLTDIRFFNNQLIISDNKELNASLKIFSLQGQELINYTISEENATIHLKLNKGFYLASIGGNTVKFMVN